MITIRPARLDDTATARAIIEAAYHHYIPRIGRRPGPMDDDHADQIAEGQMLILERSGVAAGVLVLMETPDGFILDNIAVHPAHHGAGLGRALLIHAEQEAIRRGYNAITLYTNAAMTENIALYGRIGYVETKRVGEKGFRRVYMTKPLTATS